MQKALLGPLGSVLGAPLLPVGHALRVEHAADDVIAHAGKVLDAAATDHHHRVLLQIMALAGDVADHLEAVGETHLGHLAQRRVRLLRRGCIHARTNATLLRSSLHVPRLLAIDLAGPRLAGQLLYRRHAPFHLPLAPARYPELLRANNPLPRPPRRAAPGPEQETDPPHPLAAVPWTGP